MNYLLIGGADCALKVQVIHQYALNLLNSADFDLVKNNVPDKADARFWCIFTNRVTQRSVLVNTEKLSVSLFTEIEHFKSNYPAGDSIVTLIPAPDAPDRHTLMEKFDLLPADNAVEITLDNMETKPTDLVKDMVDKIEDILTNAPFNLL